MIYFHLTTNFNYLIIILLQKLLPVLVIVVSAVIAATPAMPSYEVVFVNGLFYNNNPLFTASVNKDMHYMILQSYNNRFKSDYISYYTVLPFSISPKVFCLLYTYNIVPIILCQSTIQFSKELKLLLQVSRSPDVLRIQGRTLGAAGAVPHPRHVYRTQLHLL